ncbi:MAG: hypothetical protein PVJ54_11775 [Desulfobacterales bacterium]|jgi:hypothetical protein
MKAIRISIEKLKGMTALIKKLIWMVSIIFIAGCTKTIPAVKIAEEPMVKDCAYVATLSETADPGRRMDNYRSREHEDAILERAANLGATHVVWVYDFRVGSAAVAYRCDQ